MRGMRERESFAARRARAQRGVCGYADERDVRAEWSFLSYASDQRARLKRGVVRVPVSGDDSGRGSFAGVWRGGLACEVAPVCKHKPFA